MKRIMTAAVAAFVLCSALTVARAATLSAAADLFGAGAAQQQAGADTWAAVSMI